MANKLTAVDKLYIHLLGIVSFDSEELRNLYESSFKQAKAMHKMQIKKSFNDGCKSKNPWHTAEHYYNKTYGK